MILPNSDISLMLVRNTLSEPTLDLGTLCLSPRINEWSEFKPVSSPAPTLNEATRNYISGFAPIGRVMTYIRPSGGKNSPFRLGDFRGYNTLARRPINTQLEQNCFEISENDHIGRPDEAFEFNVVVPNTVVVKRWDAEHGIDTLTICDENGIILQGSSQQGSGYAQYKLSDLSETNYSVRIGIKMDLSGYRTNQTFSKVCQIWYGNADDWKKAQIPGGDTVTITGKILPLGVIVNVTFTPLDRFPPMNISNSSTAVSTSYNSSTKVLTVNNIRLEGLIKEASSMSDRLNFQNLTGWELQYQVRDAATSTIKVPFTKIPVSVYADATALPNNYYCGSSQSWTISNVVAGDYVTIRMEPSINIYG